MGERYNRESGRWEELYGKKAQARLGLDLYAPTARRGTEGRGHPERGAAPGRPEGLRVAEFSCGETEYDREADLYRCAAEVLCEAYLYAVADEGGAFLDFEVRGKESI